jgi:hypothetical protein
VESAWDRTTGKRKRCRLHVLEACQLKLPHVRRQRLTGLRLQILHEVRFHIGGACVVRNMARATLMDAFLQGLQQFSLVDSAVRERLRRERRLKYAFVEESSELFAGALLRHQSSSTA